MEIYPLTTERWGDLETLFGARGACGGCWCTWWRQSRPDFEKNKGEGNRKVLFELVRRGAEPVGWVSVAPRDDFPALERSRVLARVDDQPVWSVVCFFIEKKARKQGVSKALLEAAVNYARKKGAKIIEGYPIPPKEGGSPDVFAYTGLEAAFESCGFEAAVRRGKTGRGVWRRTVG
jgi:GNAT superfamily N-acetyltransferase